MDASLRSFTHRVIFKDTAFNLNGINSMIDEKPLISESYMATMNDGDRNRQIIEDIAQVLKMEKVLWFQQSVKTMRYILKLS